MRDAAPNPLKSSRGGALAGRRRSWIERIKPWFEAAQALVTVIGIIVGGFWTYRLFIMQREVHPHANVGVSVSQVSLTDQVTLVQVILKVENTGHELMSLKRATVWLQQVLPLGGCPVQGACVTDQLNSALGAAARKNDPFAWTVFQSRDARWVPAHDIEPGEDDLSDFEFVLPSSVSVVRIYGFVPNDSERGAADETGWHIAKLYDLWQAKPVGDKP